MADLRELLRGRGIPYVATGHHHCRPGWLQLDCPFCGKGTGKYHLGFNLHGLYFHCWRCGAKRFVETLVEMGFSRSEAFQLRPTLPREALPLAQAGSGKLVEPGCRGPLLPAHLHYLEARGFNPKKVVRDWRIEGLGVAGRLSWRIYIPIYLQGERVSWTTRAIGSEVTQRYLSASAAQERVSHKRVVYGVDFCRHSVVVVEGPTDAWAVGHGAGALFGLAYLPAQVRMLARFPLRVVCLDSVPEAQAVAERLCSELSVFPGRTINVSLDAKDPGCASARELSRLRRVACLG